MKKENKSKTVLKAIELLEELARSNTGLSNSEVAERVDMNHSTCHRLLSTLRSKGYVSKDNNIYRLGHKIFQLKGLSQKEERIKELIRPFLMELEEKFGYTISLGIRRGKNAIPIEIIKGSKGLVVNDNLGVPTPLHASSIGKCLLAFSPKEVRKELLSKIDLFKCTPNTITSEDKLTEELDNIENKGYAVDEEEYTEGVVCVGIPILDEDDIPTYALSISRPAAKTNKSETKKLATALKEVKKRFSQKFFNK